MENRLYKTNKTSGKLTYIAAIMLIAGLLMSVGCAVVGRRRARRHAAVGTVVYVQKAPPAARAETRSPRPNPKAVWVAGHWQWNGQKYVWKGGHWDTRPGGKSWVSGHWEKKARGWVWVPGHWR